MADRIQDLKIEVYEKELDRKQMELSNLQLQIRPHFLLNTFNLIYTLAQRGQEKDVQQVIPVSYTHLNGLWPGDRPL